MCADDFDGNFGRQFRVTVVVSREDICIASPVVSEFRFAYHLPSEVHWFWKIFYV